MLYKLVHPSATVRDDAVALLKSVAALDLGVNDPGGGDGDLHEIFSQDTLPELPDAYQAFQQNVSGTLARRRPALGEELLVEALVRQMDDGAADAGAHRHVLAALAPWTAALHLPHIAAAGRAERLLKSLYFVTFFRGDAFPREMETMWRHIGHSPRNVVPALRFLEMKGVGGHVVRHRHVHILPHRQARVPVPRQGGAAAVHRPARVRHIPPGSRG